MQEGSEWQAVNVYHQILDDERVAREREHERLVRQKQKAGLDAQLAEERERHRIEDDERKKIMEEAREEARRFEEDQHWKKQELLQKRAEEHRYRLEQIAVKEERQRLDREADLQEGEDQRTPYFSDHERNHELPRRVGSAPAASSISQGIIFHRLKDPETQAEGYSVLRNDAALRPTFRVLPPNVNKENGAATKGTYKGRTRSLSAAPRLQERSLLRENEQIIQEKREREMQEKKMGMLYAQQVHEDVAAFQMEKRISRENEAQKQSEYRNVLNAQMVEKKKLENAFDGMSIIERELNMPIFKKVLCEPALADVKIKINKAYFLNRNMNAINQNTAPHLR